MQQESINFQKKNKLASLEATPVNQSDTFTVTITQIFGNILFSLKNIEWAGLSAWQARRFSRSQCHSDHHLQIGSNLFGPFANDWWQAGINLIINQLIDDCPDQCSGPTKRIYFVALRFQTSRCWHWLWCQSARKPASFFQLGNSHPIFAPANTLDHCHCHVWAWITMRGMEEVCTMLSNGKVTNSKKEGTFNG